MSAGPRRRFWFFTVLLPIFLVASRAQFIDGKTPVQNPATSRSSDSTRQQLDLIPANPSEKHIAAAGNVLSVDVGSGMQILTASADHLVRLFDADGGERMRFVGHQSAVYSAVLCEPRGLVISGSQDGEIRVWEEKSGQELRRLLGHKGRVTSMALAPDNKTLLSGGFDGTLRLWSIDTGRELCQLGKHEELVWTVAIQPGGRLAASGGGRRHDFDVRFWDIAGRREVRRLRGHTAIVRALAFSPNGQLLASSSGSGYYDDTSVRLWSVGKGTELQKFTEHQGNRI